MFWLGVHRVRPGRRRCFVCTAPSAAAAVARESCTFLDPAAVQNCRFFGEKSEKWWQSGVGVAAEARPAATEMGSQTQVHSHATIRGKLK